MIHLSHRDHEQSSWPMHPIGTNTMIYYDLKTGLNPYSEHTSFNQNAFSVIPGMMPEYLKLEIGYNDQASFGNEPVENVGKIPFPEIPNKLRKTLSDTMFGPVKYSMDCNVAGGNTKHYDTHAKKRHIVRFKENNR